MNTPRVESVASGANSWPEFKEAAFYQDGSLRDIYVHDTQIDDWNRAAQFIAQKYQLQFLGEWHQLKFPDDLDRLFPTGDLIDRPVLGIDISGVTLTCHFFDTEKIELDLLPSEVSDPERLDAVFDFLRGLASAVGKRADLTEENVPDAVIFRALPDGSTIEYMNYQN
jgi:hypothetical protein